MRYHKAPWFLLLMASALGLGLAGALFSSQSLPVHAQQNTVPLVYLEAQGKDTGGNGVQDDYTVYEGAQATFEVSILTESPRTQDLLVQVETWEPNREDSFGDNPSKQTHQVILPPRRGVARFHVVAYVDNDAETSFDTDELRARVISPTDGSYEPGSPHEDYFDILNPEADSVRVSIASNQTPWRRARAQS